MSSFIALGYCIHCGAWLGDCGSEADKQREAPLDERAIWIAQAVGKLLEVMPHLQHAPQPDLLYQKVECVLGSVANHRFQRLSKLTGITRATLRSWRSGTAKPQMVTFLDFCRCLEINPLELIAPGFNATPLNPTQNTSPQRRRIADRLPVDRDAIAHYLQSLLENPAEPPPAMREVGRRLMRDPRHLQKLFPQECRAISARFLAYQRQQRTQRLAVTITAIRQAVHALHRQSIYPSQERVMDMIDRPGAAWAPEARAAWRTTLVELGYRV